MTKSDLIERLCQLQKLPKGRAEILVNTIFDSMEQSLRRGERIESRGFGSFEIRSYRSYEGRNPRTGNAVSVKPKRLPFFKVGKELKERVNSTAGKNGVSKLNGVASSGGGQNSPGASSGTSTEATVVSPPPVAVGKG
jgi:integration host factor subunit beta